VRTHTFAATAAPIRSDQAPSGAVLVLHDITEIRRLERARRDFVANVSHEFRTPLASIQGFAETLLSGALDDRDNRVRFLEIIRDQAIRLGRLTSDLLELAQIEAGKLTLEPRALSWEELVTPCLESLRLRASEKPIEVAAEYAPDLPPLVGDLGALQRVLQNLLDNALRYTPRGGRIAVRVSAEPGGSVLEVADTGIGIPRSEQGRIFERFYRVDPARSRDLGGTGLGLAIVKHLVELHGGRIEVESEVGRGTTFRVHLPNGPAHSAA
jgi:two-component system phosphate regulon sensor histidine kinase PhoR